MSSNKVRFNSSNQTSTPCTTKQSTQSKANSFTQSQNRTLLNSFKIYPIDNCEKTETNSNKNKQNFLYRFIKTDTDTQTDDSICEAVKDCDDEEDCEESDECSILTDYNNQDEFDAENQDFQESLSILNNKCKKVVNGRDLLQIYYSFAKWFNNLKDAFNLATSTPTNPISYRKSTINLSPIRKENKSNPSTRSNSSNRQTCYDNPCNISGDLSKDKSLRLKYEPNESVKPWDESKICKYYKYKNFIKKKQNFYDKVSIVPGIGNTYASRLIEIIENFGTLLELYLTVDECTFKSLLKSYANLNHLNLNLVTTSCKNYLNKYKFSFSDVLIRSNLNNCSKTNSPKRIFI